MLRAPTRETLQDLSEGRGGPCVSVYLPTHRHGPEIEGDRATLKRLLAEAESGLPEVRAEPGTTRNLLAPIRELLDDPEFWRSQGEGLAIFASFERLLLVRMDVPPAAAVEVGRRFVLAPLLPALFPVERFYVLALALRHPRVLKATPDGVRRVELPGMPPGMDEALGYQEFYSDTQVHAGGPRSLGHRGGVIHGHGDDDEERLDRDVTEYFRHVVRALAPLPHPDAPLVLACVAEHEPLFRQAAEGRLPNPIPAGIVPGSPEHRQDDELAIRAREQVATWALEKLERSLLRYRELGDRSRAAEDPEEILRAAHEGRVDTLFLVPGTCRWGTFDPSSSTARLHAVREPGDEDLADLAVSLTLDGGGEVLTTPLERAPCGAPMAAILRY